MFTAFAATSSAEDESTDGVVVLVVAMRYMRNNDINSMVYLVIVTCSPCGAVRCFGHLAGEDTWRWSEFDGFVPVTCHNMTETSDLTRPRPGCN